MLVYKILISNSQEPIGDTKIAMTRDQFIAVTADGGCELWSELDQQFSCNQPDLRATAVWSSLQESWLQNLTAEQAQALYESCAREPGFW